MSRRLLTAVMLAALSLASLVALGGVAQGATSTKPIVSASRCASNAAAGTITYVSPFGYDASASILDVFAADSLGYFAQLCLHVNLVTDATNAPELVSAGRGTITGEGSAADALLPIANGSHFTTVATYGDTSDYAILTRPNITKLTELAGKTLGYKGALPVVLTEMLRAAGTNVGKVHEVSVGYDPDILIENKVQALQAYRTNEPLTLSAQHAAYREWIPSQFGVKGTFNVVVVNTTFLAKHRSAVGDFLRAEFHAFDYCAASPAACVKLEQARALASGSTYDYAHALAEWNLEVALATHNSLPLAGVGVESHAEWQPEAQALVANGLVKAAPSLTSAEDTTLVAELYSGTKLSWPGQ